MSSKVLIITGMHRSGTSLVSQYLNKCGLNIGKNLLDFDSLSHKSAYNGHHEDKDFYDFHVQILARRRNYGFPTNSFGIPVKVNKSDRAYAQELIKARSHLPQWGWKDPRTTLFLDFWNGIIERPRYLFLYRDPLLVVDSLLRRGTDKQVLRKPVIGLKTWRVFNRQIQDFFLKNQEISLIFNIDSIIQNPQYLVKCLEQKLEIKLEPVEFAKIFTKKALNSQHSEVLENLKQKYSQEVNNCTSLYQELQTISKNII